MHPPDMPAQRLRRQFSSSSAVATDEPDAILVKEGGCFVALVRSGKGEFVTCRAGHLGAKQRQGHMVAARRPGGGYTVARMREDGTYYAVRSSRQEDEVVVINTKHDKTAVLIQTPDGGMQPMPQLSGVPIDPAVIFSAASASGPDVPHMLVVRKAQKQGKGKRPGCMILQQGQDNNIFFQVQQPAPGKVPAIDTIAVPTTSGTAWMTLQRQSKSDVYKRLASSSDRPRGDGMVYGQGVSLLRQQYAEVLTGRGRASDPLVSLLRQVSDVPEEAVYSVVERSPEGNYNLAPFAGEGGAIHVEWNDGTSVDLQCSDGEPLRVGRAARVRRHSSHELAACCSRFSQNENAAVGIATAFQQADPSLSPPLPRPRLIFPGYSPARSASPLPRSPSLPWQATEDTYMEVVTGPMRDGENLTVLRNNTGLYTVIQKDGKGPGQRGYVRVDAPEKAYMTIEDIKLAKAELPPPVPKSERPTNASTRAATSNTGRTDRGTGGFRGYLDAAADAPVGRPSVGRLSQGYLEMFGDAADEEATGRTPAMRSIDETSLDATPTARGVAAGQPAAAAAASRSRAVVASNSVDGTRAQRLIQAFGNKTGSFVLQGDGGEGKMAWLHLCNNGRFSFSEIEIIPTMRNAVSVTTDGGFMTQNLTVFVEHYSQQNDDLPCPLGQNLTPFD